MRGGFKLGPNPLFKKLQNQKLTMEKWRENFLFQTKSFLIQRNELNFLHISVSNFIFCFDAAQQNGVLQHLLMCLPQENIVYQSMFDHVIRNFTLA